MTKGYSVLVLILFTWASCIESSKMEVALQSLVAGDTINRKFNDADLKRNEGDYKDARLLYAGLLARQDLTEGELRYTRLNVLLCEALSPDSALEKIGKDSMHPYQEEIIFNIIEGFAEIRNGKSGAIFLLEAKKKLLSAGASNSFEYFLTSELLGVNYRKIEGKMDSALFYFKEALRLAKDFPILTKHTPRVLLEIADVCIINRDEVTGIAYANEAFLNSTDPYFLCKSLIAKGTLFRKLEKYDSAEAHYNKAQELITKFKLTDLEPDLLTEQILTAIIVRDDSLFDALIAKVGQLDSNSRAKINVDRLLGYHYYEQRNHQKSIFHYERALKIIRSSQIPDLVLVMEAFYALAEQYGKIGEFESAEEYAYKSLVYTTTLRDTPYSWSNVFAPEITKEIYNFINYELYAGILLAKSAARKSKLVDAKNALAVYKLIDSLMLTQVRVIEEEAILNFLSIGHKVYSSGIEACYQLYRETQDTLYLSQAHHFMERGKGLIMYRDILTHSAAHFPGVPNIFRAKELQMKATISNLRRQESLQSPHMMNALKELDDYYKEMIQNYPDYYKAKYELNVPSYTYFQKKSSVNKLTIVQYHKSDRYLYSLTYDSKAEFLRIEFDSILRNAIGGLSEIVSKQPELKGDLSKKRFMKLSRTVRSKIFEPFHFSYRTILIIPDGELMSVPFEILTSDTLGDFKQADYLVKKYTFKYAQSLTTHELTPGPDMRRIKNILTFSYGKGSSSQVSLPGTEKEVKSIEKVFKEGSITFRRNDEVTKSRLLKDLEGPYDLIHIGLHSSSSTSDRLANKISCSGAAKDDVYGFEITPLTIRAHTIVLSSCQSAYGSHLQGEGTYSLSRAFRQTGVNTVVCSLWNLTDQSTGDIIGNFYAYLRKENSASESLALAKRQYLSTADEITAHPYFWAAMICQGN